MGNLPRSTARLLGKHTVGIAISAQTMVLATTTHSNTKQHREQPTQLDVQSTSPLDTNCNQRQHRIGLVRPSDYSELTECEDPGDCRTDSDVSRTLSTPSRHAAKASSVRRTLGAPRGRRSFQIKNTLFSAAFVSWRRIALTVYLAGERVEQVQEFARDGLVSFIRRFERSDATLITHNASHHATGSVKQCANGVVTEPTCEQPVFWGWRTAALQMTKDDDACPEGTQSFLQLLVDHFCATGLISFRDNHQDGALATFLEDVELSDEFFNVGGRFGEHKRIQRRRPTPCRRQCNRYVAP